MYGVVMSNRAPIATGEWYHCYTRGVDKRTVFETPSDYERFLAYLYIGNGTHLLRLSNIQDRRLTSVLTNTRLQRGEPLVDIGAYALMPNHVHFVLRQTHDQGIATFMQRVFTGYTQYFNNKRERTGALFSGTYKSKHILDDRYLKQVTAYVLLNPVELFEPAWKEGMGNLNHIEQQVITYPYSSLTDFYGSERPESIITTNTLHEYYDQRPSLTEILADAQAFYREHEPKI